MWKTKDFIARKADVIKHFTKREVTSGEIAEYCSLAGIPIVVVCKFILEEMPEHREMCIGKIRSVNEFFGVVEETCEHCEKKCYNSYCVTEEE